MADSTYETAYITKKSCDLKERFFVYLKSKYQMLCEKSKGSILFKKLYVKNAGLIDTAIFCRNFSSFVSAGLSVPKSLQFIERQTLNPKLKRAVKRLHEAVQNGGSLSDTMGTFDEFPRLLVSMIKAGEASGRLEETLKIMADYYEKQNSILRKVKSACFYPAFILSTSIAVIILLVIKVLPQFEDIFNSMGAKMPSYSVNLLSISHVFFEYWPIITTAIIFILFITRKAMCTENGRYVYSKIILCLPAAGTLSKKAAASRFSRTMSMLLKNSVNIIQALDIAADTVDNEAIGRHIQKCRDKVEQGQSLSSALASPQIFPELLVSTISLGEEAGNLDEALYRISSYFEEDMEASASKITSVIEPLIMIIIGIMVFFIIMSVMLPMLDLYKMIG